MFIDNLLEALKKENISQTEICKKAGLPKTSINNWKNGSNPTIEKVEKIAELLNVSIDYLITGEEAKIKSKTEILYNRATPEDKQIIDMILQKYETKEKLSNSKIG